MLKIKHLFINQPYIALYPISDRTESEQESLIYSLNTCDIGEDSETATLLSTLYEYAQMKKINLELDAESLERNLGYSYKTKKSKTKNEETGEIEVDYKEVEKSGSKRIIERYQDKTEENKVKAEQYEDLLQALENSRLTKEHIALLDEMLKENKYKEWVYRVLLSAVIVIPILLFALAKIFHV